MSKIQIILKILKWVIPTSWLKFINGYKTIIGIVGYLALLIIPIVCPNITIDDNTMKILEYLFAGLGVYGLTDKLEKSKNAVKELKETLKELQNNK